MLDWPIEQFVPQESEVEQVAWWDLEKLKVDMKANPETYITALPGMVKLLTRKLNRRLLLSRQNRA